VILAILADKQYQQMVKTLLQVPNVHVVVTQFQGPGKRQAASPDALEQAATTHERLSSAPDWPSALKQVLATMSAEDVVLLTGSLYFISEVRHYFKETDAS